MYVQPKFIPLNALNIQITTSENKPPHRREVFVSGDGNCFYRTVAHWKNEINDEKHEEIPKSSDSLFEKNPKICVLPLFSSNSLEEKRQITESPAGTVGIYSLVHRSISDPFLPMYPWRRKGLVLRRLLMPFHSYLPQQRGNVGFQSL